MVNPDTGALYGYITAGDPGSSIAYIIPAYLAFLEIEQRMGYKVTLPLPNNLENRLNTSNVDHCFLPPWVSDERQLPQSNTPHDVYMENIRNEQRRGQSGLSRAFDIELEEQDTEELRVSHLAAGGSVKNNASKIKLLSVWDVSALIINKMIGAGIFTTPPLVLLATQSKTAALFLWTLGGIFSVMA